MTTILINGFGRIGRLITRLILESSFAAADDAHSPRMIIATINDIHNDPITTAYLLEFDSAHGKWQGFTCTGSTTAGSTAGESAVSIMSVTRDSDGRTMTIPITGHASITDMDVSGIHIVCECSGQNKTKESFAPMFEGGVKKIIVSCPLKEENIPNIVMGVNQALYDPNIHNIVTAASCTTNALAPVVQILHEQVGIKHGFITTIHNSTNTQCVVDTAWPGQKEIRRTRAASMNLIPTTTGSAKAITQIFPELDGLLDGRCVESFSSFFLLRFFVSFFLLSSHFSFLYTLTHFFFSLFFIFSFLIVL